MNTTDTVKWTIVARRLRGRFLRPVTDAPVGTWDEARAAADVLGHREPELVVWIVPTADSPQHEEDRDNVLDNGRRIPVRWDAEPAATFPNAYVQRKRGEVRVVLAGRVVGPTLKAIVLDALPTMTVEELADVLEDLRNLPERLAAVGTGRA